MSHPKLNQKIIFSKKISDEYIFVRIWYVVIYYSISLAVQNFDTSLYHSLSLNNSVSLILVLLVSFSRTSRSPYFRLPEVHNINFKNSLLKTSGTPPPGYPLISRLF
jgi:hypothetical protein